MLGEFTVLRYGLEGSFVGVNLVGNNDGNGNRVAAVVNFACQYDRNGKKTWSRGILPDPFGRISRQGIRRRRACHVVIYDEDGNIRTGKARKSGAIHTGRIWERPTVSIWSVTHNPHPFDV